MPEHSEEHVLDANVFIHSVGLSLDFENPVTVPAVVDELETREPGERFELGDVDVYSPGEDAVERVEEAAEELGESVSDADIRVLALALERGSTVVTDDYSVQNLASHLGLGYKGFAKEEIEEEIKWRRVCPGCGREGEEERCPRC
ncbi:MAG: NOB1 family endonuclease, partial [Candidatus Nanohaloarchaea archaeon]